MLLDYKLMADKQSMYNTPPCYTIYMVGLVLEWVESLGGLTEMAKRNERRQSCSTTIWTAASFIRPWRPRKTAR